MFALLPQPGQPPRSSAELTQMYYGMSLKRAPLHGRKIVIGVLSSLVKKTAHYKEAFVIKRTRRSGPIPMEFWIVPRSSGRKNAKIQTEARAG